MLVGIRSKLSAGHLMLTSFAVAFVLYHLYTALLGTSSFIWAYLPQKADTAISVHATVPTPTPTPNISTRLGLQTGQAAWPTRVTMPAVDIDLSLEGSIEQSGSWNISETGANFALNTAVPNGISGNTVLFGHDRPKLFRNIHQLKQGDAINVVSPEGTYAYTLSSTTVVTPTDISVMDQTDKPILTLLTCDGWLSQNRYVVIAQFDHFSPAT